MDFQNNSCSYCGGFLINHCSPVPDIEKLLSRDAKLVSHDRDCIWHQKVGALTKAAVILRDIFYMYRELMFERHIIGVEYHGGNLYVHYNTHWRHIEKPIDSLSRFPLELFDTREDREAVLVHMACTDSLAWMHGLINHYLKDLVNDIHEIVCHPQNPRRRLYSLNFDKKLLNPTSTHEFLLVQLSIPQNSVTNSLDLYVLDLTGAQFGYSYPLETWINYQSHRISRPDTIETFAFGNALSNALSRCNKPGFDGAISTIQSNLFHRLVRGVEKWEMEVGLTTIKFLTLEGEYFEEMKCSLLSCLRGGIEEFLSQEGKNLNCPSFS